MLSMNEKDHVNAGGASAGGCGSDVCYDDSAPRTTCNMPVTVMMAVCLFVHSLRMVHQRDLEVSLALVADDSVAAAFGV